MEAISKALQDREPLYHIGDIITIRQRIHGMNKYTCGFLGEMTNFSGKTAVILNILPRCGYIDKLSVETYAYELDIDDKKYAWSADMFEETPQFPNESYWNNQELRIFTPSIIRYIEDYIDNYDIVKKLKNNFSFVSLFVDSPIYDALCNIEMGKNLLKSLNIIQKYVTTGECVCEEKNIYNITNVSDTLSDQKVELQNKVQQLQKEVNDLKQKIYELSACI